MAALARGCMTIAELPGLASRLFLAYRLGGPIRLWPACLRNRGRHRRRAMMQYVYLTSKLLFLRIVWQPKELQQTGRRHDASQIRVLEPQLEHLPRIGGQRHSGVLDTSVSENCSYSIGAPSSVPASYNSADPEQPQPADAVQYFRASSAALTLDGYNDTSILGNDTKATHVPLPAGVDTTLLDCLNVTIGQAAPLVGSAHLRWQAPGVGWIGLLWLIWCLSSLI